MAALANGAMSHALDYEDAFDAAPVHPNASLIPAVLALAQSRAPIGGRELIAAIATGCDFACRLALSLRQPLEAGGWYPPPILAAFGAVAGAANLLRLSPQQVTSAWSLLLLQNSCAGEIKYDADTVIRAVREAFPAQAAVTSHAARRGWNSGVSRTFRRTRGFLCTVRGRTIRTARTAGRSGQALPGRSLELQAMAQLPRNACGDRSGVVDARPARVRRFAGGSRDGAGRCGAGDACRTAATQARAGDGHRCEVQPALHGGHGAAEGEGARWRASSESALGDAEVRAMAQRVVFVEHPQSGGSRLPPAVMLRQRDGRAFEHSVADPMGSPARPLTDEALVDKFVDCVGTGAGAASHRRRPGRWPAADPGAGDRTRRRGSIRLHGLGTP